MSELISIVMTSYNYSDYISEAIESVIHQTYTNWELIIVDDASQDNSRDIINKYVEKDSRIKAFFNTKNLGLADSLKIGINNSRGEWITFLESDDYYFINNLEEKANLITQNFDFIFSNVQMVGDEKIIENSEKYYTMLIEKGILPIESQLLHNFKNNICFKNIIPTFSSVMIKKNILKACSFHSFCKECLDHYLWSQISDKNVFYLNKKLVFWRMHKDSYINSVKNNSFKTQLFLFLVYFNTIKNESLIKKICKILNYLRRKVIYLKFAKNRVTVFFINGKYHLNLKI